jgi:energy-coupling factor transport system ATP-binding protein
VLGPSGSGKSTLGHCVNGLVPAVFPGAITGSLFIGGENARDLDIFSISKKVGTVLQDTDGQFVGQSAGEDIAFALENDCVSPGEMRRRVKEAADLVRFDESLSRSPAELSGGQKQRVSLAGVLVDDVEILLFDEPLANLDPAAGREAIDIIDRLNREQGKTVIIIEHRLEDVLYRRVDRIILLDAGRIAADLPPRLMLAAPLLREAGIREPLYITALRRAGIEIHGNPESVETISFDAERLRAWASAAAKRPETEGKTPGGTAPLLEIRSLFFDYAEAENETGGGTDERRRALSGVDFTVARGSITALAGKNGAGKSTLAGVIAGFYRPARGAVFFEGADLAPLSIRERAEKIGFVMQNPNHMISFPRIYDEAALGLRSRGIGEREVTERVYDAFKICGLYPYRNWPVSALSYGMKKRLTIASILVLGPRLVILDEPTAGQDLRHYREIMEFLRALQRGRDLTLLLITHDMHVMLEYADNAVVLADGKLIAAAPPEEILTDDGIIEKARLKRTSLYDLAVRAGETGSRDFVIACIRAERENAGREEP